MIDITDYPSVVLLVAIPSLWLAARLGVGLSRRFPLDDDMRHDFGTLQAAALTVRADHRLQLFIGGDALRPTQKP